MSFTLPARRIRCADSRPSASRSGDRRARCCCRRTLIPMRGIESRAMPGAWLGSLDRAGGWSHPEHPRSGSLPPADIAVTGVGSPSDAIAGVFLAKRSRPLTIRNSDSVAGCSGAD
jgi:hypothetical protein